MMTYFYNCSNHLLPKKDDFIVAPSPGSGGSTTYIYPPKIDCQPPSTPIIAEEGRCDAIVKWDSATASDGAR